MSLMRTKKLIRDVIGGEAESPEYWDRLDDRLRRNSENRKKSRKSPSTYPKTRREYRGTSFVQPSMEAECPQTSMSMKMAFPPLQSLEGYFVITEKAESDKIIIPKVIKAWVDLRK